MGPATTAPPAGKFAASDDGARWSFTGALTMDVAAKSLAESEALPLPSSGVVDFAGLSQADSAALAVMIALRRRAATEGRSLTFASLPDSLTSLAVVYGIEALVAA